MVVYRDKIRQIAKKILEEKTVDLVIGFRQGTLAMTTEPVLVKDAEKTDQLYWDSFCFVNLATYLPKTEGKIGIIAKGCDSRNIAVHIVENQIKREQLFIIGVPCEGMVDIGGNRRSRHVGTMRRGQNSPADKS